MTRIVEKAIRSRSARALAACLAGALALAAPNGSANRPNILLIVSEDNGPELGAYGDTFARTPALDDLARRGVLFRNAYVPQAGCSQSRAAFLTGLYPHQNGQIGLATWRFGLFRADTPNIVRRLKAAGYRTGIVGKLHVNPESAFPFDFAALPGANFQRKDLGAYSRLAKGFIEEDDRPFFLSVNFPDAHRPLLRQADGLPPAPLSADDVGPLSYMGLDSPTLRGDTANYHNSIARLDALVGGILEMLDLSGRADNTLVAYLGDHGADLLRGKRTSYEGGVRIPLIVRWPGGQRAGQVREELVSTIDLAPTLLEAAGAEPIRGLPGRALGPLLRGESPAWREHLYTEYHLHSNHNFYPQRTVRGHRFKLIWNLLPGEPNPGHAFTIAKFVGADEMRQALERAEVRVREAYTLMERPPEFELYDLERDPFEFRNLAAEPAHRQTLDDLKARLLDWRRRTDDAFLNPENVMRLRAEVESTYRDGQYRKPDRWAYREYLAPAVPPWLKD